MVELCLLKKVWDELRQVGQPGDLIEMLDKYITKAAHEIEALREIIVNAAQICYVEPRGSADDIAWTALTDKAEEIKNAQ